MAAFVAIILLHAYIVLGDGVWYDVRFLLGESKSGLRRSYTPIVSAAALLLAITRQTV